MLPTRANEKITVFTRTIKGNGNSNITEFGSFMTDSNARFEFKYKHQNEGSSITLIDAFQGRFDDLPLNQNFERDPWYVSSFGKLKVNCDFPLLKSIDTLFISYSRYDNGNFKNVVEFFTGKNGSFSFELKERPSKDFGIAWGINEDFSFFIHDGDKIVAKYYKLSLAVITGDPIIDEITLSR